jgi:programmed cell death protein 5
MSGYDYYEDAGPKKSEEELRREKELRESIFRVYMTSEARQRLTNISLVKPDVARTVENLIVSLVAKGRLKRRIDEEELKRVLMQVQKPTKREFKIRRI